ncbi:MAG: hypothetical protein PUC47_12105, partial [Oscillospiraceae bacterium]|nr:hypothetical protein [Oscillospiraceae bacterium]
MNKADYIRELDSLRAPEELRQRPRELRPRELRPWELRPRRRSVLRPLAAVACLTLALVGGGSVLRLLMGGMGASSGMAEGGTQATADRVFQSYAGPVLPLLQLEGDELTARRTLSMTCEENGNTLTVEDRYDLSGEGDVVFSLPLAASLYELSEMEPELYADGQPLDSTLSPGASPSFGEEPDFGWYEEALSGQPDPPAILEETVTLYHISGLPEAEEGDQTHFSLTGTLNPEESLLLTWGLSGGRYEEESGAVRVSGSLSY